MQLLLALKLEMICLSEKLDLLTIPHGVTAQKNSIDCFILVSCEF